MTGPNGAGNGTWTSSITSAGAAAMVASVDVLTATRAPRGTNKNDFNAAASQGTPGDHLLATSPTTVSGGTLHLSLSNGPGAAITGLSVGLDTVRFTAVSSSNELPGYWLFNSLDGSIWLDVASVNC